MHTRLPVYLQDKNYELESWDTCSRFLPALLLRKETHEVFHFALYLRSIQHTCREWMLDLWGCSHQYEVCNSSRKVHHQHPCTKSHCKLNLSCSKHTNIKVYLGGQKSPMSRFQFPSFWCPNWMCICDLLSQFHTSRGTITWNVTAMDLSRLAWTPVVSTSMSPFDLNEEKTHGWMQPCYRSTIVV